MSSRLSGRLRTAAGVTAILSVVVLSLGYAGYAMQGFSLDAEWMFFAGWLFAIAGLPISLLILVLSQGPRTRTSAILLIIGGVGVALGVLALAPVEDELVWAEISWLLVGPAVTAIWFALPGTFSAWTAGRNCGSAPPILLLVGMVVSVPVFAAFGLWYFAAAPFTTAPGHLCVALAMTLGGRFFRRRPIFLLGSLVLALLSTIPLGAVLDEPTNELVWPWLIPWAAVGFAWAAIGVKLLRWEKTGETSDLAEDVVAASAPTSDR